jgi:hypothetical protein
MSTAPQRQETPEASVQEGLDKAQAHSDGAGKMQGSDCDSGN